MPVEILMKRSLGGALVPTDESGREAIAKIGKAEVLVSIKQPRNPAHHKKLFVLLNLIHQNQTRYKTLDDLLDAFKVMLGYCTVIELRDGTAVRVPKSIAFHAMDQIEFDKFYSGVVEITVERILPGIKQADLEREIRDLCS